MGWLERHAWWGLLIMSLTVVAFGVSDMLIGAEADPGIPLGVIGLSPSELRAQSEAGYRIFDFFTRTHGLSLLLWGLLASAILIFAYRRDRRWAWWTMWLLPAWMIGVFVSYLLVGVRVDQAPPPPMVSGPIMAVLAVAIQLVSAPRFFGASGPA